MEWFAEVPEKSGFYWLYDEDCDEPELVKLIPATDHDRGLEIVRLGTGPHDSVLLGHYSEEEGCTMLWFGPLDLNAPEGWKQTGKKLDKMSG